LLVVNQIDFSATYANAITSTELDGGKIPMFFNNDKEAIAVAVKTCNRVEPRGAKIVRINSTLEMSEIEVSTALIPELEKRDDIEVLSAPYPLKYDASGVLL